MISKYTYTLRRSGIISGRILKGVKLMIIAYKIFIESLLVVTVATWESAIEKYRIIARNCSHCALVEVYHDEETNEETETIIYNTDNKIMNIYGKN